MRLAALCLVTGLLVVASYASAAMPSRAAGQPDHRVGPIRMEVIQVRADASWSTAYWRLTNASARPARLPESLLAGGTSAYASSGLRLLAGRSSYEPLTARRHCLCTYLGEQELAPGAELDGFATFARLPDDATAVSVAAPRFGTFDGVPVIRGQLPGVRSDPTGFAVAGIDRLPYATVLRVRRDPIQPGHAPARPEPLATTPRTPQAAGEMVLVDPATLTSYTALYRDGGGCLCANFTGGYPEIGVYVFPPLPASVRSLRAWYTGGLPVDDVGAAVGAGGPPYAPWPPARPEQSEVARYPRHDEAVFDAIVERDDMRRELRSGRATVFFDPDSATVRPRARTALRELAGELSARPGIRTVQVTGNTDRAGAEGYNLELSGRRARAVVELLDRWVIRPDITFTVVEYGEVAAGGDHPSPAERALNRNAVISPS